MFPVSLGGRGKISTGEEGACIQRSRRRGNMGLRGERIRGNMGLRGERIRGGMRLREGCGQRIRDDVGLRGHLSVLRQTKKRGSLFLIRGNISLIQTSQASLHWRRN